MEVEEFNKGNKNFRMLHDHELLSLVDQGDEYALDFLISKYKNFVWAKARIYFLIGGDRDDIIQEGMIGLYKAICDYDKTKLASFKGFADLCITRQMITAIKTATRQKHIPLNSYISLDKPVYDEEPDRTLLDIIAGTKAVDPQELLLNREKFDYLKYKLTELLSDLEQKVLHLYLEGYTYQEISEQLERHVKSIDNALQRIKRKLEGLIEAKEISL